MKKSISFLFIFFFLLSTSCDPAKILTIKSANDVAVTVFTNNKITSQDSTKRIFQVPEDEITKLEFYYGFGNWSRQAIIKFSASIDSIVFKKAGKETVLKEQVEIQHYLMKQRKNIFKSHLVIEPK